MANATQNAPVGSAELTRGGHHRLPCVSLGVIQAASVAPIAALIPAATSPRQAGPAIHHSADIIMPRMKATPQISADSQRRPFGARIGSSSLTRPILQG